MKLKIKTFTLILISVLLITTKCEKFNNKPEWINEMTDTLETNDFYWGSKIYEYEWKSSLYYYLEIPLSSCEFCTIYDKNGNTVDWKVENMNDYIKNRKKERIVWRWKNSKK